MRYDRMTPHQLRRAIDENWPAVLPLGVLEYHGEHLAVGLDTIVVAKLVERIEKERDIVRLPTFPYGAASYAVAGPERTGSLQIDADVLEPFARAMFHGLLRIGFRNVHVFIHHQTENFVAGMPTDLAFKLGARRAIFAFLEATRGEGWWGKPEMADYYAEQAGGDDPFNWIKVHPLMPAEMLARYPFDHAGKGETSLMMALCPEGVDMSRLADAPWYAESAREASEELGRQGAEMILEHMRAALG